jgi:hypothetical protein
MVMAGRKLQSFTSRSYRIAVAARVFHALMSLIAGLIRQSILFERLLPRSMDTRVKPAYDEYAILRKSSAGRPRRRLTFSPSGA